MDIVSEKLNPSGQIFSVLGHIANNPSELIGGSVSLETSDFVNPFHQVVFNAINNIVIESKSKLSEVTPLSVDLYLKSYAKYYSIWKSNDGVQFLNDAKESETQFVFEHDYNQLKKFSTLRKYHENGVDIRDLYDYETSDLNKLNKYNEQLESMSVQDIIEHYTNKVINIRDEINEDNELMVKFSADEDIESLLLRLNQEPVMGYPFVNGYYNSLFRGMQGGRFMLRSGQSGAGKAVSMDTKIPLPSGEFIEAKDVEVGMDLISRKGEPTKVVAKYPQPAHMLYKVTTYDGKEQILHPDHLMSVWTNGQKKSRKYDKSYLLTKPLSEIMKDYKKPVPNGNGTAHKYTIPMTEPVNYKEVNHKISPYALGVMLGDGALSELNNGKLLISFNEDDVLKKFMREIGSTTYAHKDYNYSYLFRVRDNPYVLTIMNELRNFNLNCTSEGKYIPEEYLVDSVSNRMKLLRGLIDTDGHIGTSEGRNGYNISFTTVSESLMKSFLRLVDSLGIGRYVYLDKRTDKYTTGACYSITLFTDKKIWSSIKHENNTKGRPFISNKMYGMQIMKIEPYKVEESVCFTVDNDEHLFLINDFIVTHNTRTAIKDLANISFSERYEKGKGWIQTGEGIPSLFISTELNKDELQTVLLAYVSGMTTSQIESGEYTKFEKERLEHAVNVIKQSKMFFVYVEDFSSTDIQMIIEEYVIRHNVKFCVFDYIQNSPKLSKTFQQSYGHNLREDEILIELSRSLKNMSEKYNIFIMSSTQLNSMSDDDNIRVSRTGRALRGGSATINKADYGIIMAKPMASEIKKLKALENQLPEFHAEPNYAHYVFKNRSGASDIIIWTEYNLGNMRETPLFVTDYNYNLIDLPIVNVEIGKESSSNKEVKF